MTKVTEEQIKAGLIGFIKDEILDAAVDLDEESTLSELGVDSFSVVELVLFLEREYGVSIQEKDMLPDNFRNVQSLARCAAQSMN